jgi:hypothetical protein
MGKTYNGVGYLTGPRRDFPFGRSQERGQGWMTIHEQHTQKRTVGKA